MNCYYDTYRGETVVRVNKTVARRYYNKGFDVILNPVNCQLSNPYYGLALEINKEDWGTGLDFDKKVDYYEVYNCMRELGKYAAYFVKC